VHEVERNQPNDAMRLLLLSPSRLGGPLCSAVLAEGSSESEIPSRPESRYSPRCLAVHPRGTATFILVSPFRQ
jgi:hypothetical protein